MLARYWMITQNCRPMNAKELFNLRHSSLRNVVERIIGVWKKRFHVLRDYNDYPMDFQAKLIPALTCVHNFIRIYDPTDDLEITAAEIEVITAMDHPAHGALHHGITNDESDQIADEMWGEYQAEVARRRGH
jgi:hypothetical protein